MSVLASGDQIGNSISQLNLLKYQKWTTSSLELSEVMEFQYKIHMENNHPYSN